MLRTFGLSFFFFLLFICVNAQDSTDVTDLIRRRELIMTSYAPDTAAQAVVLFDLGKVLMSYDGRFILERKRQVKILKQNGITTHSNFNLILDINYQEVKSLKARVVQPDSTVVWLKETDVFFEKINEDRLVVKVLFPGLKVGSIIEVNYSLFVASLDLIKWSFQEDIPIRRNLLMLDIPDEFQFEYLYKGLIEYKQGHLEKTSLFGPSKKIPVLIMDTVPAFQLEPFMPAVKDVSCGVSFNWKKIKLPNSNKVMVNDWVNLNKTFLEHKKFGQQYQKKSNYGDVWKAVKPLLAEAQTLEDSLKTVYDYVSKNVLWIDNFFSPFVEKTLENAFKKKKANSGEMNLMILACLREAGITAYPLLISTFDNGTVSQEYTSPYQFDHVLCYVQMNGKAYFLDAGNTSRNIFLPRRVSISGTGWVVDKANPRWVELPHPLSQLSTMGNIVLSNTGQLHCTLTNEFQGYSAVDERDHFEKDEKKEFVKTEYSSDYPDIKYTKIEYDSAKNLDVPLKRHISFDINEASSTSDSLLYLNPPLFVKYKNMVFKDKERTHLIVFNYPIKEDYMVNITLPDNYKIEDLPANINQKLGKDDAFYAFNCTQTANTIQIKIQFQVNTLYFHFNRYKEIKAFFDTIAQKFNEQIVLRKKNK
jgi:hypothetical protein